MNGGILDASHAVKLITDDAVMHSATKIVPSGSIMVGIRVGVGKVAVNAVPMCTSQDIVSIVGVDECRWNKEYISQAIQYKAPLLAAQAQGATITGITSKALKALTIPVRDRASQDRVVHILNRLIDLQVLSGQQLARLDQLIKSRFVEMFGDPTKPGLFVRERLGDLYQVGSSKRIYSRDQTKDGVPFYRLADIGSLIDGEAPKQDLFISKDHYEKLKMCGMVPAENDILVTARGTLGRCYVIRKSDEFYFQDGMITWLSQTPKSPLPLWLTELFANHSFVAELNESCSGTTVKYLSINDLANIRIPVPPMELQQDFASFVAQVDKSRFVESLEFVGL